MAEKKMAGTIGRESGGKGLRGKITVENIAKIWVYAAVEFAKADSH
jgi:hypothetical protein